VQKFQKIVLIPATFPLSRRRISVLTPIIMPPKRGKKNASITLLIIFVSRLLLL
jgi:hypothetical protein